MPLSTSPGILILRGWRREAVGWFLVTPVGVSGAAICVVVVGAGSAGAWSASAFFIVSARAGFRSDVRVQSEPVGGVVVMPHVSEDPALTAEPVTYAVIETSDGGTWVNTPFVEHRRAGMFMIVPAAGVRAELAALDWVLVSIGLALPEDLTSAELAWSQVLRTRPRRARLHLAPAPVEYMRVQWLSDEDVLTGAGAIAELESLVAAHA